MIYFTSDLHFNHDKEFLYVPRGFTNVKDMNEAIVENWNLIVNKEDTVYVLGDCMLGDNEEGIEYLKRLNGTILLCYGNHDTDSRKILYTTLPNIIIEGYSTVIKYGKFRFYLSHYPTLCGNVDDGKYFSQHTINLCGHTHTKDKFNDWDKGMIYHCELDAHDMKPVSIDQIIEDCREKYNGVH